MPTLSEIARYLDEVAPERLAESWDNVGLQLGNPSLEASGVLTTLECDPDTVREARDAGANVIVAHHPLLFRPAKKILADTYTGETIAAILGAGMGFICAHTNLDKAPWGTNRVLADRLGLEAVDFLHREPGPRLQKLVVFVPDGSERDIIDAIDSAGGGVIGNYRRCSFRAKGVGGFQGGEGSNPAIGQAGQYEETPEWRLESVASESIMPAVVAAVIEAHPYEEVAYEVYPIEGRAAAEYGLGLVGTLRGSEEAPSLEDFARRVGKALETDYLLAIGPKEKPIKRVGVSSGSGGHSVSALPGRSVDVLVTGELTYHSAVEARHKGLAVICAGHFASETFVAEALADRLAKQFPGLKAAVSASSTDPFWRP